MSFALTRRRLLAASAALLATPLRAQEEREVLEMAMGAEDAPVTLIEYASLTCPHCANFHMNVLPQIRESYINPGKVRMIYREVYFDRPSLWAAMIARCAGPERYFGVLDLLFRDQASWSRADSAEGIVNGLYAIGRQAGMTDAEMQACLRDPEFAQSMVEEFQKNATADQIDSTPSFILDGEKLSNLPWPEFQAKLDAALAS